jgi:alanine racemase
MKEFYRPTIAKIYLDNLIYNYRQFKTLLGETVDLVPVIKADAYGHGAVKCAHALENEGVDTLCVAFIDEAVELRDAGIKSKILLLGYTKKEWTQQIIDYDLIPAVFEYEIAEALSITARQNNKICAIHIKIDTGMGRIGFSYKDAVTHIKKIAGLDNIYIEGIFTHYASADEKDKTYTFLQKERFLEVVSSCEKNNIHIPIKHSANSAGCIDVNQDDMNMVRLGISLYGLYPSSEVQPDKVTLKPVMQLQTEVAYIKTVHKGDSISYNRRFTAQNDMIIGTLPIGYADGYRREFTNRAYVEINSQRARVLGAVCMDQIMVDLSYVLNVKKGDKVILFGPNSISADELANIAGTISYEIVCGISKRVPRIYD